MKLKLKLIPGLLVIFLAFLAFLAVAQENPPSLRNFHQLYGEVSDLPAGTFALKATVNGNDFTTSIEAQGKYGYSPTFKVYGEDGQTISFTLVSSLGLSTVLETTTTFQSGAFSQINLLYPGAGEQVAEVHGCMNESATNYNPEAAIDDGSCQFAAEVSGCTDPTAENYHPEATVNDGSCEYKGCLHVNATNYNTSVTEDDESCEFPEGIVVGCMNESASNYNASATIEYGRCLFLRGCLNETAINYDEEAAIDDGSCVFEENVTVTCLMNWECGVWSSCINEWQTRSCLRVDNCDSLVAQGIAALTVIPKPEEGRSCVVPIARVCTPNTKRCSGTNLEQCSFDGRQWNLLQSCPLGCNSFTLQCREETPPPAETVEEERKPFPAWIIYLIAALVLAGGVGAGVFFVLRQRKDAPIKSYIKQSRGKGFPDRQIRSGLINQGWDPAKIDKLLK